MKRSLLCEENVKKKRFKGTQMHICNNDKMHSRSRHYNAQPNFFHLMEMFPYLSPYIHCNKYNSPTFEFKNSIALSLFTKALFKLYYSLDWFLPDGFLIPTLPSRANYVHCIADYLILSSGHASDVVPKGSTIRGLDIGVGANAVYSLLCAVEFGWTMLGTDISQKSLDHAEKLVCANNLQTLIRLQHQPNADHIFESIISHTTNVFHFSLCNPPFRDSEETREVNPARALAYQSNEVICNGGELQFILRIIHESELKHFRFKILWFTVLVGCLVHKKPILQALYSAKVKSIKLAQIQQGKHTRWIIAWTYFPIKQHCEFFQSPLLETKSLT